MSSPVFNSAMLASLSWEQRFTPTFKIEDKPNAPELGVRIYATAKVLSVS